MFCFDLFSATFLILIPIYFEFLSYFRYKYNIYKTMEAAISSDESCDSETKNMKSQLSEFGLDEENLSKEEMSDLLKALNNSKSTIHEEEVLRQKVDKVSSLSPKTTLKRRYLNVRDRRMPWSLIPGQLTQAEKARTLAVYIKLMSINNYRQARQSPNFMAWPPAIHIVEETTRNQPLRSTRSGRLIVPVYAAACDDDDSSDLDFVVTKPKKRKPSNSEHPVENPGGKTISLKRKSSKDENNRPAKEQKLITENSRVVEPASSTQTVKKSILNVIED